MTSSEQAAGLLAAVEPTQAAAILDLASPDWAVARLAEMDPDRALMLLASMGAKRMENLLAAMERQQTVRLLSAVSKVFADQQRARLGLDFAQREAQQIIDRANLEAEAIRAAAQQQADAVLSSATQPSVAGESAQPKLPPQQRKAEPEADPESAPPRDTSVQPAIAPDELMTLPTELFLLMHGNDGRPRLHQAALELAICGATLCELVRSGLLTVDADCPVVVSGRECTDQIGALVLQSLATEPRQSVALWCRQLRRELFLRFAQRLADTGTVLPVHRRRILGATVHYKPNDQANANQPAVRLVRFMLDSSQQIDERTYLLAAIVKILGAEAELPADLRGAEVRELLANLLKSRRLTADLQAVVDGIEGAFVSLISLPRMQ
ncbi:GPP34 family phosphoprotein [Dactylosporangium sp. NPDC048998]|uniref:GOLPH3/VPS74 family protein n=1 Tax=Dactylosporangium sp. NPDC048998 TaxID=3363976 RepID=UPI00371D2956